MNVIQSCSPASNQPVNRTLKINIYSPWGNIKDCDAYMMFNDNIEKIIVQVYTVNSSNEATVWEPNPYQTVFPNQYLESVIQVPNAGVYTLTVTVIGKCNNCCASNCTSGKGKPIYSGVSNKIKGGDNIPTVKVRFVHCDCCDL